MPIIGLMYITCLTLSKTEQNFDSELVSWGYKMKIQPHDTNAWLKRYVIPVIITMEKNKKNSQYVY